MDLQNFTLFDATFATAEIKTSAGTIRVEAELFPGLPMQIDSIIWLETGTDATAFPFEKPRSNFPCMGTIDPARQRENTNGVFETDLSETDFSLRQMGEE